MSRADFRFDHWFGNCFRSRGIEFAAVFAQLRRDIIEIYCPIEIGFIADLWNLRGRRSLFGFRIAAQGREAIFIQRPPAFERPAAHLDVVLFASGKIIQSKWIFSRTDHAKIALNPGAKAAHWISSVPAQSPIPPADVRQKIS